jgi:hypothetical protein
MGRHLWKTRHKTAGLRMPRGPKGEKRPADVIGNAVHVMRVATGEIRSATDEHRTRDQ